MKLEALLDKYADIFGEDRGKLRTGKGHLQLRDDAVPKFCKARPLPYALRSKVAEELSRLESDGVISPVSWSDWATPIVPIVKKDGSVRVCGDFKVTVNPQLNVEQYPLPRIDDVFASLAGGKRFSKIDLKQAYLQMEMDDESSALLTLNTHKGLFKLNRLAFGVASAPALWQRSMDQILQGIPYTQCILDDIIVTGEDDAEHLRNLETVFRRLSEAGLRVNRLKCNFFRRAEAERKELKIAFGPQTNIAFGPKTKSCRRARLFFLSSLSFSSLFLFLVAEERADHSWFARGKHKHTDTKTGRDFSLYTFDAGRW